MAIIEPGDLFPVGYGNGRVIEVKALAGRAQRILADRVKDVIEAENSAGKALELFGMAEGLLALCVGPERAAELFETEVDSEMAIEIATKTLGKQALEPEDKKKPESEPCSELVSSAEVAKLVADGMS